MRFFCLCLLVGCSDSIETSRDSGNDATTTFDASAMTDAASEDSPASPCATGMAYVELVDSGLPGVCVDLYEGALVTEDAGWPFYDSIDNADASALHAIPAKDIFPQGYISQAQATAMCANAGKRLCTFAEWTAACRGQPAHDYIYPYGDTYDPTACNEGRESPIVRLFSPNPTYSNQELNDPECDQLDAGLARGGAYSKCVSTYGAFDMHGNLHEWIDDSPDPKDPSKGSFMGGYFVDAKINGLGCEYRTTAHAKTYHDYSTGFRCCADPK